MKSSSQCLIEWFHTGKLKGYRMAVWVETQKTLDVALYTGDPRFIGVVAGIAFARREMVVDHERKQAVGT